MTRAIWLAASCGILAILLAACSTAMAAPRVIALTGADAGRTVAAKRGDRLEVSLAGNPTTGYQWEAAADSSAWLKQVGQPEFKADSSLLGAGGVVTLRFEATQAGEAALKLIYHRSFEKDTPPLNTFSVTVTIK